MRDHSELLRAEFTSLSNQWAATRDQWNDKAAIDFERDCWQELEQVARRVLQAMEDLDVEMNRAIQDSD